MLSSAILSAILLASAIFWRKGFGFMVWVDLIISAANAAVFLDIWLS
jgi:hypothetical protein